MPWVEDPDKRRIRDSVVRDLSAAANFSAGAQKKVRAINGLTLTTMGSGHHEGDRLLHEALQAEGALQRASVSIERAASVVRRIDISIWIEEPSSDE